MGQILDKFQGKEWRKKQVRKIANNAFDRFKTQTDSPNLTFEDLYIAVLVIYKAPSDLRNNLAEFHTKLKLNDKIRKAVDDENDINKYLPGPHFDPPSKEHVRVMMEECDMNLDGELDRTEFINFVERLTVDTFCVVSQGLIITLVLAPSIALATKKATEGVPGVGKVVKRVPNSVYASLVALAVVMMQKPGPDLC